MIEPTAANTRDNGSFSSTTEYLKHLVRRPKDLAIALKEDQSLINLQGEDGKTLLHHGASIGLVMGSTTAGPILDLLLNSSQANFTIQDKEGNTPVHVAAHYCRDRVTCRTIFPEYVKSAVKHKFNFDILNHDGQAVIHIATLNTYEHWISGRENTVGRLLQIAENQLNVNILSASGSSAFHYAVCSTFIKEAHLLLDAGADPTLCSNPDRNTLKEINNSIDCTKIYIDLAKAYQTGTLGEFIANEEIKNALIELFKESEPDFDEPDFDELEIFAEKLADTIAKKLSSFELNLSDLESLKSRMLSIAFTKNQEKTDRFYPFWSKADSKAWDAVHTKPAYDDQKEFRFGFNP